MRQKGHYIMLKVNIHNEDFKKKKTGNAPEDIASIFTKQSLQEL